MEPRQKFWLERSDGRVVMSDYRLRLLEFVAETGSLAQAAARLELSYRRAWGKVRELEENLGYRVVDSVVGGPGGGHTRLTPEGEALVAAYRRFQERARAAVDGIFAEEFGA
ncbi:MAG: winged helix-turn-helix domain-containing protein [Dehalococcoidia bacterium]